MRLIDPSSDLAVAAAIASAANDVSMPADAVFIGEVGLAGDIRRVTGTERRLAEAARLGFKSAMVPPGVEGSPAGLRIRTIDDIGGLLQGVQRFAHNGGWSEVRWTQWRRRSDGREAGRQVCPRQSVVQLVRPTLRETLGRLAPGTPLRDGLERILRGQTGALIVLGYDDSVESICDGGF